MFVENTKGGVLAKNLREVVERIKGILGYRVKIVERAGTPLKLMFPLSKVGQGGECGKRDCTTCTQESRGEILPPCSKRSVVYENICIICNPGVVEGEKMKKFTPPAHPPSIYVGETSRSLYERGKEHWRAFVNKQEDSHINKHHIIHHQGVGEPKFHLRPVCFSKTALTRQITEAVLIQRWGEDILLNSKAEFNRSKISRLTLFDEEFLKKQESREPRPALDEEEQSKPCSEDEEQLQHWEEDRCMDRRTQELRSIKTFSRGVVKSPAKKRIGEDNQPSPASVKKTKRRYSLLSEDWGEETTLPDSAPSQPTPDQSGLEGDQPLGEEDIPRPPPPPLGTVQLTMDSFLVRGDQSSTQNNLSTKVPSGLVEHQPMEESSYHQVSPLKNTNHQLRLLHQPHNPI